jgi:hypothetical protein
VAADAAAKAASCAALFSVLALQAKVTAGSALRSGVASPKAVSSVRLTKRRCRR